MRQRTKFAIALFFVALVVGGVVFGGLQWFRGEARAQAQQELQQTADVVANQTTRSLGEFADGLREFGSKPETANRSIQGRQLQSFTDNSEFRTAVIIDRNGTIVAVRGAGIGPEARDAIIGTNASEPYIRAAFREGKIAASGPIPGGNGSVLFQIAAPNFNSEGERIGVVAGSLPGEKILSPAQTLDTGARTAKLAVWNGTALVSLKGPSAEFRRELNRSSATELLVANATASKYGLPFTVTLKQNPRELTERLNNLTVIGTGSLLIVFFAVISLGYWEYNTNLKQTERLLEGFSRLREGHYDYEIDLSTATEWQRISEGYNELTRGLAEREREIREREQQLEVLNRVLRHNLQNDMNVIIGHAEMLPRFSDDDRVEDAAETIVRMGEGLVSHGRKARHLETVMGGDDQIVELDANRIVSKAISQFEESYPDVDFRLETPDRARVAASDAFEYAIQNLVENAAEHNDADDPFVEVTVTESGDTVDVQVLDNGPGIPEHEYEVLEEGAESALQHGSGVGLWLAHWIVDRSNGWLSFADRSPTGSIVTVTVPKPTDDERGEAGSGSDEPRDNVGIEESD